MSDDLIKLLAIEQRRRLVAGILNAIENSPAHKKFERAEWQEIRAIVQDKIGVYHDFMLDVIKVSADDSLVNVEALGILRQVRESQVRMLAELHAEREVDTRNAVEATARDLRKPVRT